MTFNLIVKTRIALELYEDDMQWFACMIKDLRRFCWGAIVAVAKARAKDNPTD